MRTIARLLYIELLKQDRNAVCARLCLAKDIFVTSEPISLLHESAVMPMNELDKPKYVPIASIIGQVSLPTVLRATIEPKNEPNMAKIWKKSPDNTYNVKIGLVVPKLRY